MIESETYHLIQQEAAAYFSKHMTGHQIRLGKDSIPVF